MITTSGSKRLTMFATPNPRSLPQPWKMSKARRSPRRAAAATARAVIWSASSCERLLFSPLRKRVRAAPAIARAARTRLRSGEKSSLSQLEADQITARAVAAAARRGDRLALDIFQGCGKLLGFGVANMVSLFDPEVVIIGGGLASAADLYLEALKTAMYERAQPLAAKQAKITVSTLGELGQLLGSARLAWEFIRAGK